MNVAFIGATFHTITDDWELKSVTLENQALAEAHTADNLAEAFRNVLNKWSLNEHQLSDVTVDNALNRLSLEFYNGKAWDALDTQLIFVLRLV